MHARRTIAVLAAAAAALSLAGCSTAAPDESGSSAAADGTFPVTIEHAFGETEIPAAPERVATWGWGSTEAALALGVVPVAMAQQTYGANEDGVLPWVADELDELGEDTPVILTDDGGSLDGSGNGELLVATPFQTRGYLKDELNDEKFGAYPGNGDGEMTYYRTGDIVRRDDDGVLSLVGRADFYVKVRGVRVSTQVVEQAIQEHPDVVEVAVLAVPDELAGSRLHAVLRLKEDSKLNSLTLRKHCASRLARTEMPSKFEIVTEPLPTTSTGKIDRKACLARIERTYVNG